VPSKLKVHYRDIRFRNNMGIDFPTCFAGAPILDMEKSYLPTSGNFDLVTCRNCIKLAPLRYPWANLKRSEETGAPPCGKDSVIGWRNCHE
jgi:hypothetical protein